MTAQPSEIPWLADVQQPPEVLPDDAPRLPELLLTDDHLPITTADGWRRQREVVRNRWLDFIGRLPDERPPLNLEVIEQDRPDGCVRQLLRYDTEADQRVEGYLLYPQRVEARARPGKPAVPPVRFPGVVVLHSTIDYTIRQPAGLEGPPEYHIGLHLARRGIAAFCPRCFLWNSDGEFVNTAEEVARRHPGWRGLTKMLWDASRGLDLLESLDFVDPTRLGCAGHSLGAKEALFLAGFDERVHAAVSSEGGIGLDFSNWEDPWYLGEDIRRPGFALENHQVLALVAPRAFLLLAGASADGDRSWPFIEAVMPVYDILAAPRRVGLFNHRAGHAIPPEAEQHMYEWLDYYL